MNRPAVFVCGRVESKASCGDVRERDAGQVWRALGCYICRRNVGAVIPAARNRDVSSPRGLTDEQGNDEAINRIEVPTARCVP